MRLLLPFIITLTFNYLNAQSPWTLEKGKSYIQFNYSTISNYNEMFGNPDYQTERIISDNTFQFYGEYGLSNRTTLLIAAPFKNLKTGNLSQSENINSLTSSGTINNFGNFIVGVKHKLSHKKWLVTTQLTFEVNTSSYDNVTGIRTAYDAWTATPVIVLGHGYNKTYLQLFSGFDLRTNNYSSNFKIGGEFGYKVLKHLWFIGYLDIVQSLENGSIQLPTNNLLTGLYVNDQSYGGYGLKLIGEITKTTGITSSFGGAFFGNNVAKKVALNFGIFQKF